MSKLLSIAIPSYNAERFLDNVLSRFTGSPVLSSLDIIVVNDGSKDSTLKIAQKYAKEFPSEITVVDKENGGHGSGINQGIVHASGKYFKLVDADDWLDEQGLIAVIDYLKNCDDDMVLTPYFEYDEQRETTSKVPLENIFNKAPRSKETQSVSILRAVPAMHTIIYKTSILKQHYEQIKIDEKSFYVDVEYIVFPLIYIGSLSVLDTYLYCYRTNEPGQSTSIESLIRNKNQHHQVLRHINEYLTNSVPLDSPVRSAIEIRLSQMMVVQFKIIVIQKYSRKTYKELVCFMKEAQQHNRFDPEEAPRAIRMLWHSKMLLYPVVQLWVKRQMRHNHQ